MKKSKVISLLAVSALSVGILTACSSDDSSKDTTPSSSVSASADVFAGATAGTKEFESLEKGLAENGAWLNATTADIDASDKTLTVEGLFANNGTVARKLALYSQDEERVITSRYTLTVKELVVNSPSFYISNGTVKGDVQVNAAGFYGQSGKGVDGQATIDGNLYFASQDLLDAYNKTIAATPEKAVKVTGKTDVKEATPVTFESGLITIAEHGNVTYKEVSDVQTGATAGTDSFDDLTKGVSSDGAWLAAIKSDVDATGKSLTVDGAFMNNYSVISRKLALYDQDENRKVTARYTLTLDKLIVNSPQFLLSNGTVKGDVYVAEGANGFRGQSGEGVDGQATIDGNLYFATQDLLDAYEKLEDDAKVKVTGKVAVGTN